MHASNEDKRDNVKHSFHEEVGCVFGQFPRYNINILLGVFNLKIGREDTFKLESQE
jgi:hypothetical protein